MQRNCSKVILIEITLMLSVIVNAFRFIQFYKRLRLEMFNLIRCIQAHEFTESPVEHRMKNWRCAPLAKKRCAENFKSDIEISLGTAHWAGSKRYFFLHRSKQSRRALCHRSHTCLFLPSYINITSQRDFAQRTSILLTAMRMQHTQIYWTQTDIFSCLLSHILISV